MCDHPKQNQGLIQKVKDTEILHPLEIYFLYLQTNNTYCTFSEMLKYLHIISYVMQVFFII
jgi:hypothetical protein